MYHNLSPLSCARQFIGLFGVGELLHDQDTFDLFETQLPRERHPSLIIKIQLRDLTLIIIRNDALETSPYDTSPS